MVKLSPKTIHGKTVSHDDFRRRIIEIIRETGGTPLGGIATLLGPEHDTPEGRKKLTQVMRAMLSYGAVAQDKKTWVYRINENQMSPGVSKRDQWENTVLEMVRNLGGIARHAEILWEVTAQSEHGTAYRHRQRTRMPHGYFRQDILEINGTKSETMRRENGDYAAACAALKRLVARGALRRDFSVSAMVPGKRNDGWYNLPPEELAKVPVTGQGIDRTLRIHQQVYDQTRPRDDFNEFHHFKDEMDVALDQHLTMIARACQLARQRARMTLLDVVKEIDKRSKSEWNKWQIDCQLDLSRLKAENKELDHYELLAALLDEFENFEELDYAKNVSRRHIYYADAAFYRTFAEVTGVCPVALTRGWVLPVRTDIPPEEDDDRDWSTYEIPYIEDEEGYDPYEHGRVEGPRELIGGPDEDEEEHEIS